eukprot:9160710-Prorocentrum_lima.AAC.1
MVGDLLQEVAAARKELSDLHALRDELQALRQEAKRDVANAIDEIRQAVKVKAAQIDVPLGIGAETEAKAHDTRTDGRDNFAALPDTGE